MNLFWTLKRAHHLDSSQAAVHRDCRLLRDVTNERTSVMSTSALVLHPVVLEVSEVSCKAWLCLHTLINAKISIVKAPVSSFHDNVRHSSLLLSAHRVTYKEIQKSDGSNDVTCNEIQWQKSVWCVETPNINQQYVRNNVWTGVLHHETNPWDEVERIGFMMMNSLYMLFHIFPFWCCFVYRQAKWHFSALLENKQHDDELKTNVLQHTSERSTTEMRRSRTDLVLAVILWHPFLSINLEFGFGSL